MKQILLGLTVVLTFCFHANAQKQTAIVQDSVKNVQITISQKTKDKVDNTSVTVVGMATADSDSIDTVKADSCTANLGKTSFTFNSDDWGNFSSRPIGKTIVSIVAIITIFGLPVFILFVVFFFRYKNRKARYHLAEQAIAAGYPLPEGLIKENRLVDIRSKGIQNTFTGIGLFIFLWALTGELGIGCIGILVMFMGIGQWIIGKKREDSTNKSPFIRIDNDENSGKSNIKIGGIEINNTEKEEEQK